MKKEVTETEFVKIENSKKYTNKYGIYREKVKEDSSSKEIPEIIEPKTAHCNSKDKCNIKLSVDIEKYEMKKKIFNINKKLK